MLNRAKEEQEEFVKCLKNNKVVKRCMEELNKINEDPIFREYMSYEEDQRKIFNSRMAYATETGLKNGFEKGMKEGIKEGIEQGKKESLIEVAKNLLSKNISIDIVSETTGLTIKEIKKLK